MAGDSKTREISLMFSGGVDSTMTAVLMAEKYDRIHLLSFGNGYGHYRIGRTRKRAKELTRRFGERFVHRILPVKDIFERILVDTILSDYRRYGSGFIWCMGCKIAMHTRSVLYCLEHDIPIMADGSSGSTGEMVEQMLVSVHMIGEFYDRFGIEFKTPVYAIPREEEIERLKKMGFRMGVRIGSRFLGIQPKCRPGELYYLPFLLFNQPPLHDEETVTTFIEEKQALAEEIVRESCRCLGIPAHIDPAKGD